MFSEISDRGIEERPLEWVTALCKWHFRQTAMYRSTPPINSNWLRNIKKIKKFKFDFLVGASTINVTTTLKTSKNIRPDNTEISRSKVKK